MFKFIDNGELFLYNSVSERAARTPFHCVLCYLIALLAIRFFWFLAKIKNYQSDLEHNNYSFLVVLTYLASAFLVDSHRPINYDYACD